jgi:hypothetical protein
MNRATGLLVTAGLMSVITPAILSQEIPREPHPMPPSSDALGPQLIAWSELQKPQPVQPPPQFEQGQRPDPQASQATGASPSKPPQARKSASRSAEHK